MTTTVASLTSNTTGVLSKGLNEVNGPTSATTFGTYTFPLEHTAGASINDGPAWRDYWAEIYEKYAVIGCKYKIIIKNACLGNRAFLVAYEMDSYKNGSTGNKMPDAPYANIVQFKGIKYKNVDPYSVDNTGNYTAIIEGTYKPGDVRRNIQNDGDVKLWYDTASNQIPDFIESMHLRFYRDPLCNGGTAGATPFFAANVEINLDFIVQYKDLKEPARYPLTTGQTALTQSVPVDALINNTGTSVDA